MFSPSFRLSLLLLAGCTVAPSSATPAGSPSAASPTPAPVIPTPPPTEPVPTPVVEGSCTIASLELEEIALGAVGVAPDGTVYVAGDTGAGNPWQLGVLDPDAGGIEVLIQQDSSWLEASYIDVGADQVSLYEFYPSGAYYRYDRAGADFTLELGLEPPYVASDFGGTFDGVRYAMQVGSNDDFVCGNVCIVALDGASAGVILDDADAVFQIHTGGATFLDGWAYLNTYDPNTATRWFRRVELATGEVEVLHTFGPSEPSGWVDSVLESDGSLFWLRGSEAGAAIDRFDPATGALELDFIPELGTHVWAIHAAGDHALAWSDPEGVWVAATQGDPSPELRVALEAGSELDTYFAVHADQLWYTRRIYQSADGSRRSVLGCVELLP